MGRKFRLGVHRKNVERKKLLAKPELLVSYPAKFFHQCPCPVDSLEVFRERILLKLAHSSTRLIL